jgi:transcription elongation factor SPT6
MKIAKDARGELPTQVEGETEDGGVEAVQSIMEDPGNALDNIDLRVFAHELEKQGHGDKLQTLTDIVRELQAPSKDTRLEYKPLNSLQLFMHLTGETVLTLAPSMGVGMRRDTHPSLADLGFDPHEVFAHGPGANELFFYDHIEEMPSLMPNMLVACQVTRLAYKENDDGPKSVGFSCRIVDSEIQGFVPIMEISDDHTEDAAERVEPDMIVQARILQFNIERFSVRLSTKSSVLRGEGLTYVDWAWDPDFDTAAFVSDREALESKQAKANK